MSDFASPPPLQPNPEEGAERSNDRRLWSTPNEEVQLPDGRIVFLSRSLAVLSIVTAFDEATDCHYVAVSRRGPSAPDFNGAVAICGGYLDRDESLMGAAIREVYEEVGLNLYELADAGRVVLSDQPQYIMSEPDRDVRQNVTAHFHFELQCLKLPELTTENSEPGESVEAFWLKLDRQVIMNTSFAFNHDRVLLRMNGTHFWWDETR